MATNQQGSESEEEYGGFPCEKNKSARARQRKKQLANKILASDEENGADDDDSDDFKGSIKSSGRKRKVLEAFESENEDDESGSDEGSSDEDDEDEEDDDDNIDNDEYDDTLDVDLNDDDDVPTNSEQCPICLMSLKGQKLGTPSDCQHVFCLACISEWSKNANTCPVDRKTFHEILVHTTKKGPILQRIPVEDRQVPDVGWEQEPTYCEVCNQCDREDRMLLCDGCDKGFHLECLRPRLYTVPAGSWYCTTCLEIHRSEQIEDEEDSLPELMEETFERSRDTVRDLTSDSGETGQTDGSHRARTAAIYRRRSTATRGRGRGRGRTGSRASRGGSRSNTGRRSRTSSSTRRGRGGKRKTRKRRRTSSTTGKPKRKKRKQTSTKKKRRTTTAKSKTKRRKSDNENTFRHPFDTSFRGRTPKERLTNSLRASGNSLEAGRGLGMSSGLSIFGDNYALDGFVDDSTNEPEQSDSSSVKSANSDVLGSIFDCIETLHDENATVSRDGRVIASESRNKHSPNKGNQIKPTENSSDSNCKNVSSDGCDVLSIPRDENQDEIFSKEKSGTKSSDSGGRPVSRSENLSKEKLGTESRDNGGRPVSVSRGDGYGDVIHGKIYDNETRDGAGITNCSREQNIPDTLKSDDNAETPLHPTVVKSESVKRAFVEEESRQIKEESKLMKNDMECKINFESQFTSDSKKMKSKTEGLKVEQAGDIESTKKHRDNLNQKNSSHTDDLHITSNTPTLENHDRKSPKLATNNSKQTWIFSKTMKSNSNSLQKQPTPSASISPTRFKIPKKSPSLPESSCLKDSSSPENLPDKHVLQHSTTFSGTDSDALTSRTSKSPLSINNSSTPRSKATSPVVLNDKDCQHGKLPNFLSKETGSLEMKSSTVVPKSSLPKTSLFASKYNETNSEKKEVLKSDTRDQSHFDSIEKNDQSTTKLDQRKSDLASVTSAHSYRSAFEPVIKSKEKPMRNLKSSEVNKQEGKQDPTATSGSKTEIIGQAYRLESQSPSFHSKPLLQQLPSLRSCSPSIKKLVSRPPSTGFSSTDSSAKTENQTRRQGERVIEYSKEKGELKVKFVTVKEETHPALRCLPPLSLSVEPPLPSLNTLQPLSALKPLKPVAKQPTRPKLKMLSTCSDTSQTAPGTLFSGIQSSRDPNRTKQNLAIIQMLHNKTSSLRAEVEKGQSLLRDELNPSTRQTPENLNDSSSRGCSSSPSTATWLPQECSRDQGDIPFHRPKLSSLLGPPRSTTVPVAVVRPSPSYLSMNDKLGYSCGPSVSSVDSDSGTGGSKYLQALESERDRNRKKGIARLQRIARIKDAIRYTLQPYYDHNEITRQDFKEIFTRAVDKVKDSNREVELHRIASLVKKYVKMFKGLRLMGANQDSDL